MTFEDSLKNIQAHSIAMYSTWVYHKSSRVLFDAGEGLCVSMRNFIFGVDKVFISHGHYDHIGGLAGMIYTRAAARGDKEKPLTIYYPKGTEQIENLRDFVSKSIHHIKYDLKWVPIQEGEVISVGKKLHVESFKVKHTSGLCLGYKMVETRKRLKPELEGKPGQEIAQIAKTQGADAVNETYGKIVFAYCGDSAPVRASSVAGADVVIHEATFLDEADRSRKTHSSAREAMEAADYAGVESLILIHISSRYPAREVEDIIRKTAKDAGWNKPLAVLVGSRMIQIM